MNEHSDALIIDIATLKALIIIYPDWAALVGALQQNKLFNEIPIEYTDYADLFFFDLIIKLSKNTGINKHIIKLVEDKQLPYKFIYNLKPIDLETLKAYVKTYLKTRFIQPFESPAYALIFFNKEFDYSLYWYINY